MINDVRISSNDASHWKELNWREDYITDFSTEIYNKKKKSELPRKNIKNDWEKVRKAFSSLWPQWKNN